jgi:hypothetical protein
LGKKEWLIRSYFQPLSFKRSGVEGEIRERALNIDMAYIFKEIECTSGWGL